MSEANRVRISMVEEVTWGVTPVTGNLYVIPHTSVTGNPVFDNTESATVRSDRQLRDIIKTMERAEGSIEAEWNLKDEGFNLLLEGLAFADRGAATAVIANVNIAITGGTGAITAGVGTPFTNLVVGQRIRMTDFANTANNGIFLITAKTSNTQIICASQGLVTETAGAAVNIQGQRLVFPGQTLKSYTIEIAILDLGIYWALKGCQIGSMDTTIPVEDLITLSFNFTAQKWEDLSATSLDTILTLVEAAVSTEAVLMTGCSSIALVKEDETTISVQRNIQNIDFNVDNGLEPRYGVGKGRFPGKIRKNTCRVTGSFTEDLTSVDIISRSSGTQFTAKSLGFIAFGGYESTDYKEKDRYAVHIYFPAVKYTEPDTNLGSLDEEAEGSNSFTSIADVDGALVMDFFPAI